MYRYVIFSDGTSIHTLKWIRELSKYFDLYLISMNGVDGIVYNYIDRSKVWVLNEKVSAQGRNYSLIFKIAKFRKIVDHINPHFLNAHYLSSYGLLAALTPKGRWKLIQSTWGSDILVTPFENKVRYLIAKYALSRADYITADSYFVADRIKEILRCSKPLYIFPFGFDEVEKGDFRKDNIIFSNRALKANYNIDKIIVWFKNYVSSSYELYIANTGYLEERLKKLSKGDNRIKFLGFVSNESQKEIYKKAKFYISIPSSDSTSVSLLEAMRYGCIPIVSNIPANREWILDGINGVYFRPDLRLDEIDIHPNYYEINITLLKRRAIFPKEIKRFVEIILETKRF